MAEAGNAEAAGDKEEGRGGMEVLLHPLCVLNISDHYSRATAVKGKAQRVVGALLGVQRGRKLEVHTSFELVAETSGDEVKIDLAYAEEKRSHYMQVFPTYDLVGWYTSGRGLTSHDTVPHQTIMQMNESPIVILMDPTPPEGTTQLPLWVYETVVRIEGDSPSYDFSKVPYVMESEESERISVDNVAHGTSSAMSLLTPLGTYRDAVRMLQARIRVVRDYLAAVHSGKHPVDHALLRNISSLCHKLPAMESAKFSRAYQGEFSDAMLIAYLGTLTKTCSILSELVDKHNTAHERTSRTARRGPWY